MHHIRSYPNEGIHKIFPPGLAMGSLRMCRLRPAAMSHRLDRIRCVLLSYQIERRSNKSYSFTANARIGEVQGERPYSFWKITLTVLAAIAAVATTAILVNMPR